MMKKAQSGDQFQSPPKLGHLPRVITLVDHPDAGEQGPVVRPWLIIWITAPSIPVPFRQKRPRTMNPMWLTEL